MQASLLSQKQLADSEITGVEEFLSLLRVKRAVIELQVGKADKQIGIICEVLDEVCRVLSTSGEDDSFTLGDFLYPSSVSECCNNHVYSDDTSASEESITLKCHQIMDELMGDIPSGDGQLSD